MKADAETRLTPDGPLNAARTLRILGLGRSDSTVAASPGEVWRTPWTRPRRSGR